MKTKIKVKNVKKPLVTKKANLADIYRAGYGSAPSAAALQTSGYQLDQSLSSGNQQVYFNPTTGKLLYNVSGTHNLKDWGTDVMLGLGRLKKTKRYKEAEEVLKKAKDKYPETQTVITGHSLGASIGQRLASKKGGDEFYGYNAGYTFGSKTRSYGGKQHHYRTEGDIVSLLGSKAKHMHTLKNPHKTKFDVLKAHQSSNIENQNILI